MRVPSSGMSEWGYSYSYSYSSRWDHGMESSAGHVGPSTSTALRAEYEYEYERESRDRSSANPGLPASTPPALGGRRAEMRVPSPWMCEGGTPTRTRANGIMGWSRGQGVVVRVRVPPCGLSTSTSKNGNREIVPRPTRGYRLQRLRR
jgi:hypothetical protein